MIDGIYIDVETCLWHPVKQNKGRTVWNTASQCCYIKLEKHQKEYIKQLTVLISEAEGWLHDILIVWKFFDEIVLHL